MSGKSRSRRSSFVYAFAGLKQLFSSEPNARIHLAMMLLTLAASFYFDITKAEWLVIILCFGLVFVTEIFNTSLEFLCDHVTGDWHKNIKRIKDLSAAAVLVSAITALIAGLIIFIPYLYQE